jgi:Protein of unknown function (DUF3999)
MKLFPLILPLFVTFASTPAPEASIAYFTNVRDIHIAQPGQQNYFVVDDEIWNGARPDLADLRIYDGESQVQYALSEQRGGTSTQEESVKILNLGSVSGLTEFDLEMGQISEYNRVRLNLDARNFVVTASVEGSNELGAKESTQLPPATLYDLTREELGSNLVLKLPASSFHYLHVKLSAGIVPAQLKGASVSNLQETKAAWISVGSCSVPAQNPHTTEITCNSPQHVPVDRVRFLVDTQQMNFRRTVAVSDATDRPYGNGGAVTRVRMNRDGKTVIAEEMDVPIANLNSGYLKITVGNGDNPPLALLRVQLLSVERRIYFDPQGKSLLRLYYGDDKLGPPVYDYARFFKAEEAAAKAELGPGTHNQAYRGRPDDRPWTERHKSVLWLVMVLAVVVLAALAIKGLKGKTLSP